MGNQANFYDKLFGKGMVDERKAAVIASAKVLPNGEWGMCLLCVNKNILSVYDTNLQQNIGEKLYDIDLTQVTEFKSSSFVFNRYMKFVYMDFRYKFTDFGGAKKFIASIESQITK